FHKEGDAPRMELDPFHLQHISAITLQRGSRSVKMMSPHFLITAPINALRPRFRACTRSRRVWSSGKFLFWFRLSHFGLRCRGRAFRVALTFGVIFATSAVAA